MVEPKVPLEIVSELLKQVESSLNFTQNKLLANASLFAGVQSQQKTLVAEIQEQADRLEKVWECIRGGEGTAGIKLRLGQAETALGELKGIQIRMKTKLASMESQLTAIEAAAQASEKRIPITQQWVSIIVAGAALIIALLTYLKEAAT